MVWKPCVKVSFGSPEQREQTRNVMNLKGVRSYEADLRVTDQY